ncbi:MAG: succinate dehydrogenase/fumarate reductase iron-sulfur subunit [Deltaproteobacteria bacterium]|nr:succinate dehydrogenase/fumarate reductase iron-sulfur subunit [Deltaproteobacteria bacterium]
MKVRFRIRRFDPLHQAEPYWQAYSVEVKEGMTVLEALLKISEDDDPTLSFRRSCRSAICGSCAMTINGFPRLACSTQVLPQYRKKGEMTVEPLSNHQVIKDLAVDMTPFWNRMEKVSPYLAPKEEPKDGWVIRKEDAAAIDSAQKCIMCGSCNAVCDSLEADPNFIGPAASVKAWRLVGDVREGMKKKRLERLSEGHGVWDCVRCVHCTEYCPKDVRPLEAIERLRAKAIEKKVVDNHGAKHTLALVDSVKRVGRLDEAAMTFKTLGFLRSLGMIPLGLKMEMHGKLPHLIIFPAIDGIKEVRKIYSAVERRKKKKE